MLVHKNKAFKESVKVYKKRVVSQMEYICFFIIFMTSRTRINVIFNSGSSQWTLLELSGLCGHFAAIALRSQPLTDHSVPGRAHSEPKGTSNVNPIFFIPAFN